MKRMKRLIRYPLTLRVDPETLEAIDRLREAYRAHPGQLSGCTRSQAIRKAILECAAKLDDK